MELMRIQLEPWEVDLLKETDRIYWRVKHDGHSKA